MSSISVRLRVCVRQALVQALLLLLHLVKISVACLRRALPKLLYRIVLRGHLVELGGRVCDACD
jgi:hypothetical protein